MKSIVLFINSLSSGGAEHQLTELANGLAERGYDVTITSWADMPDHYHYSQLVHRRIIAIGKNSIIKMLSIWWYFFKVETNCVIGFGQRANRFFLLPLFFRSHSNICAIAGERSVFYGALSRREKLMLDYLYRRADFIVTNSYTQRHNIINLKPNFKDKTITITNYTDISVYKAAKLPNGELLRIIVVGRYSPPKNCIRFVEAIRLLTIKTKVKFRIEWYGRKHNNKGMLYPDYVEMDKKVKQYGLQNIIQLNDHVKDVSVLMTKFDAFCLPSLWEGFSNAVGEAISCGRPCIISNVSDNPVMVKDGYNGFLFDPIEIDSIVEAFLKYFGLSSSERDEMGKASRSLAETLFNIDVLEVNKMKIAIHHRPGSFSDRWIEYCKNEGIDFKIVNAYSNDITEQVLGCDVFMWHHHHGNYMDVLFAKQLIYSLESKGIRCFPSFHTTWHFDDKVGQKYLLESLGVPFVKTYVFYTKKDACEWIRHTSFPKVFKLRGGAGASNVRLVHSNSEALSLTKKAFGRGFHQYSGWESFKDKIHKYGEGKDNIYSVLKSFVRIFVRPEFDRMHAPEKGYIYFQDFIPNNNYDIRIIVVGDKAFAIKRMVRKKDFRASGSGNIIYDRNQIPELCIIISFKASKLIKSQSTAYDYVFCNGNPYIVEISYAFTMHGYDSCPGYWTSDLVWHEGAFNPQVWMIEDVIKQKTTIEF